ncbi:MAG: glycosyltransferase family 9 protein [bacterium]
MNTKEEGFVSTVSFSFFKSLLKNACIRFLEKAIDNKAMAPSQINKSQIHRILIVKAHDRASDLILCTPVLRAVRQHFPDAHIAVLVKAGLTPLVQHSVYLDEIIPFNERIFGWSILKVLRFFRKLRSKFDLAMVLNTVSHSLLSDLLAYFSKARYVLGSEHLIFPYCKSNFFYNLIAPYARFEKNQSERNLDIVRYLGVDHRDLSCEINLAKTHRNRALDFLIDQGMQHDKIAVAIHLGARHEHPRWPVDKFVKVARHFSENHNANIVVTWFADDAEFGLEFENGLPFKPITVVGRPPIKLAAVFSFCHVFIGQDSEAMYLAAGVGTPSVVLFSKRDPALWQPMGEEHQALRMAKDSPNSLSDSLVIQAAESLMKKFPRPQKLDVTDFDISEQVLQDYLNTLNTFE